MSNQANNTELKALLPSKAAELGYFKTSSKVVKGSYMDFYTVDGDKLYGKVVAVTNLSVTFKAEGASYTFKMLEVAR